MRRLVAAFTFATLAASCRAPVHQEQNTEAEQGGPARLDRLHENVSGMTRAAGSWIDSFLADERSLAEENESWVRMRIDSFYEEREGLNPGVKFDAQLAIPNAKKRFQIVISGDPDGDVDDVDPLDDNPISDPLAEDEDRSLSVALNGFLKTTSRNNIRFDLGSRFDGISPDPYVGARWRHFMPVGNWGLRGIQRVRWYTQTGVDSRTTVDLERALGPNFFQRTSGRANWEEEDDTGWTFGASASLFHKLGKSHILVYEWTGNWATEPEDVLTETRLRVRWSRRVIRDWIRLEIAPQISWREELDYASALGILIRLEFIFGRDPFVRSSDRFPGDSPSSR